MAATTETKPVHHKFQMVDHREKEARDRREREKREEESKRTTNSLWHFAIWTYGGKKYTDTQRVKLYGLTASELEGVTVFPGPGETRDEMD